MEEQEAGVVESSTTTIVKTSFLQLLSIPELIQLLDYETLKHFVVICKETSAQVSTTTKTADGVSYWWAICRSFAYAKGLYVPSEGAHILRKHPRNYYFDELVVAKHKWETQTDVVRYHEFKIKVGCRFRPGARGQQNMCLPLHQFLKVKRKAAKDKQEDNNNQLLVGEMEPPEYLDPFLGSLMREPVLLTSSGKICDRVLAVQCILRGGKDPFNGQKLTQEMLIPQPELAAGIAAWRAKKESEDVSVGVGDVKSLITEGTLDPELLEALLEADRLDHIAKRAQIDAANRNYDDNDDTAGEATMSAVQQRLINQALGNGVNAAVVNEVVTEEFAAEREDGTTTPSAIGGLSDSHDDGRGANSSSRFSKNGTVDMARVIDVNESKGCASLHVPGMGIRPFFFSSLYDGQASQQTVFDNSACDAVSAALNGFNACVLLYGQTGSGKTHTSFGPDGALDADDVTVSSGIVVRACAQLLAAKRALASNGVFVSLSAQFVEIYEEQITDLLTGSNVSVRRESGELVGALEEVIDKDDAGMASVMSVLRRGHERKRFAATAMNDRSSRSHTAFIVQITQTCKINSDDSQIPESSSSPEGKMVKSQLHLIDLAGSERVKKSKATGVRMREAIGINSSLLVLGKVIAALVESDHHVPYLESKLTTMLRKAFGGNSRTTAIIACRSDDHHGEETLQSMRFGERCGMISNSTRLAASSVESALLAINNAVTRVTEQVASLERRGKTHLESYQKLAASLTHLQRKRDDLVKSSTTVAPTKTSNHHQRQQTHGQMNDAVVSVE